jgi:hypothetical protein
VKHFGIAPILHARLEDSEETGTLEVKVVIRVTSGNKDDPSGWCGYGAEVDGDRRPTTNFCACASPCILTIDRSAKYCCKVAGNFATA